MQYRVSHLLVVMTVLAVLLTGAAVFSRNTQLAVLTVASYAFVVWIVYEMREK